MLEAASLTAIGVGLLAGALWTRGRGVDELVDFGRELYVAWRISEGDRLYLDLRYEYGAVSPHLNGLVFWLFGPGIRVLEAFNLLVLGLATAGWHRLLWLLGGPLCAFVGSGALLALFAFGHFEERMIFHHLAPYSHSPVHGLALGAGTLLAVHRHLQHGGRGTSALLGALVGLAFVMKPEVALALGAAAAVGLLGRVALDGSRSLVEITPALMAATAVIVAVALGLATRLPAAQVPDALLAAWRPLLDPVHMANHFASFSRHVLGLDDPGGSIGISLVACAVWAVILGPAWLLARRLPDTDRTRFVGGGLAFVIIAGLGIQASLGWESHQWAPWGAPPLVFCAFMLGGSLLRLRARPASDDATRTLTVIALCLLAFGFLSRTGIRPRFVDYGFVAGVPAFAVTVLALLHALPRRLARNGNAAGLFRGAALGLVAFLVVGHLDLSRRTLETRRHPVGSGLDRIFAAERGPVIAEALALIEREVPEGAPLLVVPEGAMLNYLSRRPSATPHLSFIPPMLAWFGEEAVVQEVEAQPPFHVLFIDRETGEFGPPRFGHDYAVELAEALRRGRRVVGGVGPEPLTGAGFGVRLLAPLEEGADVDP